MGNYGKTSNDGRVMRNVILMQPVTPGRQLNYPQMEVNAIRKLSSVSAIVGVLSIAIQVAALLINVSSLKPYINVLADLSGHGIWGGVFYLTTGCLGMAASQKWTRPLLVGTAVMSAISIALATLFTPMAGITAGVGFKTRYFNSDPKPIYDCYIYYGSLCDVWRTLEWLLFVGHFLGLVCAITITVLVSKTLCACVCCDEPKEQPEMFEVIYDGQQEALKKSPV